MDTTQLQASSGVQPAGYYWNPPNPFFGMLPASLLPLHKQEFTYSLTFNPINATVTTTIPVAIDASAHFAMIVRTATITDTTRYTTFTQPNVAPFLVLITDTASGQQTQDLAQPIGNLFGNGLQPYLLPMGRVFGAGTSFNVQLQNLHASTNFTVVLSFGGFKIYNMQETDIFSDGSKPPQIVYPFTGPNGEFLAMASDGSFWQLVATGQGGYTWQMLQIS